MGKTSHLCQVFFAMLHAKNPIKIAYVSLSDFEK